MTKAERSARAKRIRELMIDEGYTRKQAEAWVDFEGDYKTNASL